MFENKWESIASAIVAVFAVIVIILDLFVWRAM